MDNEVVMKVISSPSNWLRSGINLRALWFALSLLIITLALPARAADAFPKTITHELGSTTLNAQPKRVVVLEFSFVQALDALGDTPVGIADDNKPQNIEQLLGKTIQYASVGTRLEPNLELISALHPDLIIADERRHSAIYRQLSSIAPTIVLNSWDGNYQDIKDAVITIADALGDKAHGEQVIQQHQANINAIAQQIPATANDTFLLAVATSDAWSLHTSSSFSGSVFEAIGVHSAIDSDHPIESGVGLERLLAINPDVLLVATDPGRPTIFDQMKNSTAWKNISAVKQGRVYQVNRNQYARFRGLATATLIANDVFQQVYQSSDSNDSHPTDSHD